MLINKNSIFSKITLFFIVLIITAHGIIYLGYNITKQQQIDLLVNRYMKTLHRVHENIFQNSFPKRPPFEKREFEHPKPPKLKIDKKVLNKHLLNYDLELSNLSYEKLKTKARLLQKDRMWELYDYNGFRYFYKKDRFEKILIKDNLKMSDKTRYLILLTILLNLTFILFYIFLINKLKPLKKLKKDIVKFSKGDLNINTSCKGKDEISEVSNEFNNAINEIRELTESRNLFLRNIMHELKTPITKGALVCEMMVDGKHKDSLKRAFARLQYLLHEFAKIEQLTSKNINLRKDNYRVVDMIDQAIDILMIEREKIDFEINDSLVVNVDFQLFSLALKNLIDNGIKYSKEGVLINLDKKILSIHTKGEKLPKRLNEYLKPFNREYETSTQSLGLGLYIVQSILKVHNLSLEYKYEKGTNIFYIDFN